MIKGPVEYAPAPHWLFRNWAWLMPLRGLDGYYQCSDGYWRHTLDPRRKFAKGSHREWRE